MNILYVCENNVIRSVVAEILTREKTADLSDLHVHVDSAGLKPYNLQLKPSSYFFTALRRAGYKTRRHVPKDVTVSLMTKQDVIIAINRQVKEALLSMAPEMKPRIHSLAEFSNQDVPEFSESLAAVAYTSRETAIEFWTDYIKKLEKCVQAVISRIS